MDLIRIHLFRMMRAVGSRSPYLHDSESIHWSGRMDTDARYCIVTKLTNPGFEDFPLGDQRGFLLTVITMVLCMGWFFKFFQMVIRPGKVKFSFLDCESKRQDPESINARV